jgi:hypothetical protein
VKAEEAVLDTDPLKGQGHSTIPWKTLNPEHFLDVRRWIATREIKDRTPDWKIRLRDARHAELVGKVIKCAGSCEIFRGAEKVNGQYLSRIREGDEVHTGKDSTLWIFLVDGTLARLGSETSVSFNELNLTAEKFFFLARLNQGHIFWHPRGSAPLAVDELPETDSVALPVMLGEANQQHFERQLYHASSDRQRLDEVLELNEKAVVAQFARINELKLLHNEGRQVRSQVMLVAPNATFVSEQLSFDLVHVAGAESFFKVRGSSDGGTLHLRGYQKVEPVSLTGEAWHQVTPDGRSYLQLADVPAELQVSELMTRRIKTMELVREFWYGEVTRPIIATLTDPRKLAVEQGYVLWGAEHQQREEFLSEYTRRMETTHLQSVRNLYARLEASGDSSARTTLSPTLYQAALNHYLLGLKSRYTSKEMQVRQMSDLQYYVWTLKNGKL